MADTHYDASAKMQKLFAEKQKQRLAAKQYFQKLLYNPHRPATEGAPFDPSIQRFSAMSAYHNEYFKPKAKHFAAWLLYLSPIPLMYYWVHVTKAKEEAKIRSGQVSYRDREFKWLM